MEKTIIINQNSSAYETRPFQKMNLVFEKLYPIIKLRGLKTTDIDSTLLKPKSHILQKCNK